MLRRQRPQVRILSGAPYPSYITLVRRAASCVGPCVLHGTEQRFRYRSTLRAIRWGELRMSGATLPISSDSARSDKLVRQAPQPLAKGEAVQAAARRNERRREISALLHRLQQGRAESAGLIAARRRAAPLAILASWRAGLLRNVVGPLLSPIAAGIAVVLG